MGFNTIHDGVLQELFIVSSWDGGEQTFFILQFRLTEKMACHKCHCTVVLLTGVALLNCVLHAFTRYDLATVKNGQVSCSVVY